MNLDFIEKAGDIVSEPNVECVLALIDLQGYPTASAMTISKNDGIKWLTFCTNAIGNKIQRIAKCNKASVCLYSVYPLVNITLVGTIEIINDPDAKQEMWYDLCKYYWSGPRSEHFVVLKFTTERYNIMFDDENHEGSMV